MLIKLSKQLTQLIFIQSLLTRCSDRCLKFIAVGAGFAFLHLILTWQLQHRADQVILNGLFWIGILGLLHRWFQRTENDRLAQFIGRSLLAFLIVCSLPMALTVIPPIAWFVRLFPAGVVLSLALLISGFRPRPYWQLGLLLLPLMLPKGILEGAAEQAIGQPVQVLTAQFAAILLHYLGFDTVQQGTVITLEQGAVDVLFRCTGIPLLILLLQLALLFFVVFPISRPQQIQIIGIAVAIAFWLSTFRVALMAVVVQDPIAFAYWHDGNGSQIFSTGAIVLLGWSCQQFLPSVEID